MRCFNQINTQLIKQCTISDIPETNMEMETSDVSYKTTTTTATTAPGATEKFSDDLKNLYDTIDLLSSGTHTLKDELKSLDSESVPQSQSLEMADKLLETTKTSIEESNSLLAAINTNMLILQQNLSLLKQTYEDQQVSSYDGTLVWKITQFQDKMSKNIR
jgi:chromosome segregation ATPase